MKERTTERERERERERDLKCIMSIDIRTFCSNRKFPIYYFMN